MFLYLLQLGSVENQRKIWSGGSFIIIHGRGGVGNIPEQRWIFIHNFIM